MIFFRNASLKYNKFLLYVLFFLCTQGLPSFGEAISQSWRYTLIKDSKVTVMPMPTRGASEHLIDGDPKTQALFNKLKGASVKIEFGEPRIIQAIGILRLGWETWAIPETILIKINNGEQKCVELRKPRSPAKDIDILNLNPDTIEIDTTVRTIEITVIETESTSIYNICGTLEIFEAARGPISIDLNETGCIPVNAEGLNLTLDVKEPINQVNVKVITGNYPFRRNSAISYTALINDLKKGQNTVNICWEQFNNQTSPELKLNPFNIYKIEIEGVQSTMKPIVLSSWNFIFGEHKLKTAWEQLAPISHEADADGWRMGIPSSGFGRFGWSQGKGLLVGNLTRDTFDYMLYNGNGSSRVQHFIFKSSKTNQRIWDRLYVDWTGVVHQSLMAEEEEEKTLAPDKRKKVNTPISLIYSILVPGFLINSESTEFSFGCSNAGIPSLLYVSSKGLQWTSTNKPLNGGDMVEGWLVAVWPEQPNMPVMFTLKHRPTKIIIGPILVFEFPERIGRIAIGTPSGFREWNGKAGSLDEQARSLAEKSRVLSEILRAYPKSCHMKFKDTDKNVLVRETFEHIIWNNDWNEQSRAIAPISPLLNFASDMKYPVELPKQLIDIDIPTKVGPYRHVNGSTVEYRLPLPPTAGRMYLRPAGMDELADYIAAQITQKTVVPKLETLTNIAPWILWTSRALGLTLMNDSQRKDFLDSWKVVFEAALKPYPWYLRTEPWSGTKYIYSFAWLSRTNLTFGDINSGNGAILYAANIYARSSGDWDLIKNNWPLLKAVQQYYQVHHDWCYMQPPCHESAGDSAYDMDLIGYLGAVGFLRMAETLGKDDDIAIGRLLVARFSVSLCMRWLGAMWVAPDKSSPEALPFSSPGLTDSKGFVNGQVAHYLIGLSLCWKGSTPEAFECQLWGCGEAFWKYFEYELIEKMKPPFRTEENWFRHKNIDAHFYMRGLLGASAKELRNELEQIKGCLGLRPSKGDAQYHTALYAMVVGKDFPVKLKDWGKAALLKAEYDTTQQEAVLKFTCAQQFKLILELDRDVISQMVNGQKRNGLSHGNAVQLELPAGESTVKLLF